MKKLIIVRKVDSLDTTPRQITLSITDDTVVDYANSDQTLLLFFPGQYEPTLYTSVVRIIVGPATP